MKFRKAVPGDEGLILTFIRELADYEGMLDQVVADEATLHTWIFEKGKAEVLFVLEGETEVGFALFFHNFSTFLGRAGLYLEDLFVLPEERGKGYGEALLKRLARITVERVCPAGVPRKGLWKGTVSEAGAGRPGTGLRQDGVVVPGLEPALH